MHILSLETSTQHFALAIANKDTLLCERYMTSSNALEDAIITQINQLCDAAHFPFERLEGFAVGLGPGSFTSLRVGLATVKAFAHVTSKPIVGINSLDIIAHGTDFKGVDQVCVIVDARRGLVYSAIYTVKGALLERLGEYQLSPLQDVLDRVQGKTLFTGDALGLYQTAIQEAFVQSAAQSTTAQCQAIFAPKECWLPKAQSLVHLAWERFAKNDVDNPLSLVPMYLYAQDCQVQK